MPIFTDDIEVVAVQVHWVDGLCIRPDHANVALACAFRSVNYHFFMGDGILPGIDPAHPYNESVSLDTLMAPMAFVTLCFNFYVLSYMSGVPVREWARHGVRRLRSIGGHGVPGAPRPADAAIG